MHRLPLGPRLLAVPLALLVPSLAQAAEPTMPLADVRAGMQCTALSVVQDTTPTTFSATVLGIDGGPRPADSLIIMRFSGPAIEGTGIGQGFSGSPVSCPDGAGTLRVIGAISQGIGQYDNLVAGVTPIEAMLATPTTGNGPAAPTIGEPATTKTAAAARATTTKSAATSTTAAPWGTGRTPLLLNGVRGPLATRLARAATANGRPMSVGGVATRAATPGGGLAGGDAVAVSSVTGDVSAGAIGTVTYVDGDRVWAFGHPFNGTGAARLLMQQASITTVIGSPNIADQVSYKLGVAGAPVGTVAFDGAFAIGGLLGGAPSTIPTTVTVRNGAGAIVQTAQANVIDERAVRGGGTTGLLPLAAAANAGAALQRLTSQATVGGAARTCTTITLKGQTVPLYQCADAAVATPDSTLGGVETGVAEAVAAAVSPTTSAERFLKLVDRVHVDVRVRDEADTAEIVRVRRPKTVRAGKVATVRVVVIQGSTGDRREIPISVRIPKYAAGMRTGIAVLADPIEASADDSLAAALFGDDDESFAPPKNLPALRSLYTAAGISGIRVIAVPGMSGDEILATFAGEDTGLEDDQVAELQKQVKVGKELPTVTVAGSAALNVRPTR
jgi:hypothetical protein